ncbi:hypothetical protein K2F54_18695 [Cryobacterium sp. 1639]|uniref:hypothetical protein n=1 Tax=Cryobacterium inferilacus TaxID=2866629 RepID=UPI001C736D9F|nr:hypothetical protein [Cryobacterium sp. 1639]MBX0301994.1 hypothetical protein [Cryobacterium sp. 1639]
MTQSIHAAKIFGDKVDPRVRLVALFGGEVPEGGQPPAPALAWARGVLRDSPSESNVAAISILRRAKPEMTLKTATFLAAHAIRN